MAKKNEILLSIALEGDAEVKSKLASVGETGKKSLADIEKNITDAGKAFGKLPDGGGGLERALGPLLEGSGLQGAVSSISGLLSKIGTIGGAIALPAGLAAIGTELAKIREEAEKTETRLKALGAADGAFNRLRESGRKIDADPKALASGLEDFLPFKRRQEAQSPFGISEVSEPQFLAAQRALIAGGKIDRLQTPDAIAKANNFLGGLYAPHDLGDGTQAPGLVAGGLAGLSPSQRNRVARSIGGELNVPINNATELDLLLQQRDRRGRAPVISPDAVFRALQRDEPAARAEAEKNRTLGDASERTRTRFGDIKESLGQIFGGPAGKAGVGVQDTFSEGLRHIRERIDANAPLAKDFGASGRDLGNRTGVPGLGRAGELLGTTEGFAAGIARDTVKGYGSLLGLTPGVTPETSPESPYGFLQPLQQREQEQQRIREKMLSAPVPGASEPQPVQPAQQPALEQRSDAGTQQFASLGTALQDALQRLVQGVTDKANSLGPTPDNKIQGPVDGLGVRGEGESTIKSDVAEASGALKEFAGALYDTVKGMQAASAAAPKTPVQAAAGGGLIRHLDAGGHLSGPGTSTSDSIPAMLSDGEYVIKASSARKIGRSQLDWLNAGNYAGGGLISRMVSRVKRLADGGSADALDPAAAIRQVAEEQERERLLRQAEEEDKRERKRKWEKMKRDREEVYRMFNPNGPSFGYADDDGKSSGVSHFATGGAVGNLAALSGVQLSLPHLADGGFAAPDISGPVPDMSGLAPAGGAGGSAGHYDVDLRTNHGDFRMMTTDDVARKMTAAARDAANASAGAAPGWEYGR